MLLLVELIVNRFLFSLDSYPKHLLCVSVLCVFGIGIFYLDRSFLALVAWYLLRLYDSPNLYFRVKLRSISSILL